MKKENYKFFKNSDCEFFPCHQKANIDEFNCLFCYCPLYALGSKCGGNYKVTDTGVKDCSDCLLPHQKNSYDYVISKWSLLDELAKSQLAK